MTKRKAEDVTTTIPEETGDKKNSNSIVTSEALPIKTDVAALESAYRKALALFKTDKSDKDQRRAKSAAKKAWDRAVDLLQDGEQLQCRDCSQMFMFTTEEQAFYAESGWAHRPLRCRLCAEMQKARRADRTVRDSRGRNMCYSFQQGRCQYGDACIFSHAPKQAGKKRGGDGGSGHSRVTPASSGATDASKVPAGAPSTGRAAAGRDKNKKSVVKAMTKALKKAPGGQLQMKELRKLIGAKLASKNKKVDRSALKAAVSEAIATHRGSIATEGKLVRWIL
mmetsp:Transcript_44899/g.87922  ORF Transcript_44899/g.87922 Transcript_44899/m.87922 type:complete len:281 (-) Transcript_44899:568-1410(-)